MRIVHGALARRIRRLLRHLDERGMSGFDPSLPRSTVTNNIRAHFSSIVKLGALFRTVPAQTLCGLRSHEYDFTGRRTCTIRSTLFPFHLSTRFLNVSALITCIQFHPFATHRTALRSMNLILKCEGRIEVEGICPGCWK